jgi:hypothetical protein
MKMMSDEQAVIAFHLIPGAWLMQFEDGWYAYRDDEPRLGPVRERGRSCASRFEGLVTLGVRAGTVTRLQ